MAGITGPAIVSDIDVYSSYTRAPGGYHIGDKIRGTNGSEFAFAWFGELGVVGDIMQSSVVDTQFDDMVTPTSHAAGVRTVTVTNGTTSVTVNQFDGGVLTVSNGESYTIIGHDAGTRTSGQALHLVLDRPLRTAWVAGTTTVSMRRSPYSGVIKCPTTLTGTVVGVCVYPVASASYGWIQTKGQCGVLSDNSTGAVGSDVGVPGATAGSVGVNVAGTGKSNTVGRAMRALSSAKIVPIDLCI